MICCRSILLERPRPECGCEVSLVATVQPILWPIVVSADSNRIYDFLLSQELAMSREQFSYQTGISSVDWDLANV